jgi:hypothetical protein|tara:strand:- start:122 stop:343 length:222 start_codon:yes stop_codon:yes gene_type:complete
MLVVEEVELIIQEQQVEHLLVELVEQVYLEQVAVLPDQQTMELLIEEEVVDLMVKLLVQTVMLQEQEDQELFI